MVDAIDDIASWLTAEASETGDLVEQNDLTEANERIRSARRQIRPLRERIAKAMIEIRGLEGEFIEMSGAV
jgi:transcription elongation GreA/GreB family factor